MYIKKKFRKNSEAVSPVVATLILVLVAVASATAFYLWQTNWQTGQTDKIDDAQPASTIDVAGSTTVYELAAVSADGFMREHPLYKVNVLGGGSSVGVSALLDKSADMGMVSSLSKLDEAKSKNADVRGYTLGYDAVTPIAGTAALTAHGIAVADFKMNKTVCRALYYGYPWATPTGILDWADLEAICEGTAWIDADDGTYGGVNPAVGTAITLVDRSDSSGTEAFFVEMMSGVKDKQLQETVAPFVALPTTSVNGNTGVIATVVSNTNAIGFASWGVASKDAGISIPQWSAAKVGTDAANYYVQTYDNLISKVSTANNIRPLIVMTIGPAQGLAKDFIEYMLDETNNKELCAEVNYLSLYK